MARDETKAALAKHVQEMLSNITQNLPEGITQDQIEVHAVTGLITRIRYRANPSSIRYFDIQFKESI